MFSTLAYENKKEKKGYQPNHDLDKETYIARDTWMPSLENIHTCNSCLENIHTCNSCLMVFTVYGICTAQGLYVLPRVEPEEVHTVRGRYYPMHCKNHETAVLYW